MLGLNSDSFYSPGYCNACKVTFVAMRHFVRFCFLLLVTCRKWNIHHIFSYNYNIIPNFHRASLLSFPVQHFPIPVFVCSIVTASETVSSAWHVKNYLVIYSRVSLSLGRWKCRTGIKLTSFYTDYKVTVCIVMASANFLHYEYVDSAALHVAVQMIKATRQRQ